jgi:hypothetical protein
MTLKILSAAALSLAMLGGVAFAESEDAGAYRPPSPSNGSTAGTAGDGFRLDGYDIIPDVDVMETGSIRVGPLTIGQGSGPGCGESSKGGGGEPTAVDPTSPSVAGC